MKELKEVDWASVVKHLNDCAEIHIKMTNAVRAMLKGPRQLHEENM